MDISIQEAQRALASNRSIRLIDVRTPEEYRQGCIAGSINVPLATISSYRGDKNTQIFVYCQGGGRSIKAKQALIAAGYTKVTNIGGISGWPLTRPY